MPADFRLSPFDPNLVQASGKHVGRNVYWKLYTIENLVRVLINTVLSSQINTSWWSTAVAPTLDAKASHVRSQYTSRPWHSQPGFHNIYFIFLPDLNEIIRANSHLFLPIVPDIDQWIARFEQVRIPRNIVGHMNWPSNIDQKRIDVLHSDLLALIDQIAHAGISMAIP